MPRMRYLKPEFFANEELAELAPLTRLLFQGLWCWADRDGRLEDRPKRLKAQILPYDDGADVDQMLGDLAARGFIERYEVDGLRVISIPKFSRHQRPHQSENPSELPPNPNVGAESAPARRETSTSAAPNPRQRGAMGNGEWGMGNGEWEEPPGGGAHPPLSFDVFRVFWNEHITFGQCRKATDARKTTLRARCRDPDWLANWQQAVIRARDSPFCRGENERGWKANVDWFLRPDTVTKLLEGAYDGRRKAIATPQPTGNRPRLLSRKVGAADESPG